MRIHVYPYSGDAELRAIGPSTTQGSVRQLQQRGLAETYQRTIFANVSGILTAAIDDERIRRNPCAARSVTRSRGEYPKVVPWTPERVIAVRATLGERYHLALSLGAGCGLRQGEVFGLSLDDIDEEDRVIHVVRQIKLMRGRLVFAAPKHGRVRDVPAAGLGPRGTARPREAVPAADDDLSVARPGESTTVRALTWTRERGALNRNSFNHHVWKPAMRKAGVAHPKRGDGFHALRHFYASVLLDGGGRSKLCPSTSDTPIPLRPADVHHLMPSSAERTRRAVDAVLTTPGHDEGPASLSEDGNTGPSPEAC